MNSLSWLIYAAGLEEKLALVLGLAAIVYLFAFAIIFLTEVQWGVTQAWFKGIFICWIIGLLIVFIVPDKQTVALIAVSELGQQALDSPALKNYIESNLPKPQKNN
jgi:hypothetical protein